MSLNIGSEKLMKKRLVIKYKYLINADGFVSEPYFRTSF